MSGIDRRFSVAPMMDWTDRHCRYFLRGFSPRVLLYTEMITAEALLRGDAARLLQYSPRSSRWRCSSAAVRPRGSQRRRDSASRRATTRSTSTAVARAIACTPAPSAPASWRVRRWWPSASPRCALRWRCPVTVKMRIGTIDGGTGQPHACAPGRFQRARLRPARGFHGRRQRRRLPDIHRACTPGRARRALAEGKSRGSAAPA